MKLSHKPMPCHRFVSLCRYGFFNFMQVLDALAARQHGDAGSFDCTQTQAAEDRRCLQWLGRSLRMTILKLQPNH